MLAFISAGELKMHPAGPGKFGEVLMWVFEANNSHFLGTILRILMGQASSTLFLTSRFSF